MDDVVVDAVIDDGDDNNVDCYILIFFSFK